MQTVSKVLAATLQEWRARVRRSRKQAAADLQVAYSTWGHWESGVRFPSAGQLDRLSKYTEIPVNCLVCPHWVGCPGPRYRAGH